MADQEDADLPRRIERLLTGSGNEQVHRLLAQLRGDMDELRTTVTSQLAPVEEYMRAVAALVADRDPTQDPSVPALDAAEVRRVMREEIESLGVGIRTDVDAVLRSREHQDGQAVDGLALRITNLSMSVSQALDAVRAQVQSMTDRAERLEAEHAAVLEAVRSEIAGISLPASGGSEGTGQRLVEQLDTVSTRLDETSSQLNSRLASLEQAVKASGADDQSRDLEAIQQRLAALPRIAEQLSSLVRLPAMVEALDPLRDDVAALTGLPDRIEQLASVRDELEHIAASTSAMGIGMLPRIEETLARLEQRIGSLADVSSADPLELLGAPLQQIREQLADLSTLPSAIDSLPTSFPDPAAATTELATQIHEQLAEARRELGAQIDDMRLDSVDRLSDLEGRLHAGIREAGVSARADDALASITARVESTGARTDEVVSSLGGHTDMLQQFSIRLDGLETAVARALVEARTAFEGATARSSTALEKIGGEFAGLAEHVRALETASTAVREQLAALPRPADVSAVVAAGVASLLEPMLADLDAAATNVAEIWMRLRGVDTTLTAFSETTGKQLRSALARAESGTRRMEHIAGGEMRLAAQIQDAERRLVEATKAIEGERDKIFVEALALLAERLAKRDRTVGTRLRSVLGRSRQAGGSVDEVMEPVASLAAGLQPEPAGAPLELTTESHAPGDRAPATKRSAPRNRGAAKQQTAAARGNGVRSQNSAGTKEPKKTPQKASTRKKRAEPSKPEKPAKKSGMTRRASRTQASKKTNGVAKLVDPPIVPAPGDPSDGPAVGAGTDLP